MSAGRRGRHARVPTHRRGGRYLLVLENPLYGLRRKAHRFAIRVFLLIVASGLLYGGVVTSNNVMTTVGVAFAAIFLWEVYIKKGRH